MRAFFKVVMFYLFKCVNINFIWETKSFRHPQDKFAFESRFLSKVPLVIVCNFPTFVKAVSSNATKLFFRLKKMNSRIFWLKKIPMAVHFARTGHIYWIELDKTEGSVFLIICGVLQALCQKMIVPKNHKTANPHSLSFFLRKDRSKLAYKRRIKLLKCC